MRQEFLCLRCGKPNYDIVITVKCQGHDLSAWSMTFYDIVAQSASFKATTLIKLLVGILIRRNRIVSHQQSHPSGFCTVLHGIGQCKPSCWQHTDMME